MGTEPKPDIVFILCGNVGWGDFGVYGGGTATPRIVTPQWPMLFDLASDPGELYNLLATKMDIWMLGVALNSSPTTRRASPSTQTSRPARNSTGTSCLQERWLSFRAADLPRISLASLVQAKAATQFHGPDGYGETMTMPAERR